MSTSPNSQPRIGLGLSGGGFRATAFGLGALRTLHERNLLQHVTVVSGISGGSLLAAIWAYGPADFDEFDRRVTDLLRRNLQGDVLQRTLRPRFVARKAHGTLAPIRRLLGQHPVRYSRTDLLVEALTERVFGDSAMHHVTHSGLDTVITATDMATGTAVRFGSARSSNWRYGKLAQPVHVAEAVAASAAFPVLLPPLQRRYQFTARDNTVHTRTLDLTDGGVYDNLGLSTLLPGRDPEYTEHVYDVDYIVAVDAAPGRRVKWVPALTPFRLARAFDITYNKTQDGTRARLNSAAEHNDLAGFVHAYLPTFDDRLPRPVPGLVPREHVLGYPTDFAAMTTENLRRLTTRGQQLTSVLLDHYCPELS